jgi:ectoine hydroxylase-related dioxygenase (phytanoyl-CoA dioxygenase family)
MLTTSRTRIFDCLALLPRVQALNTYFLDPGYNISSMHTISILPGETPQELHCDDGFCNLPRPRPPLGTAIIIALDDFTADNGATRVVPQSHKWGSERRPRWEESKGMVCEAGSVV